MKQVVATKEVQTILIPGWEVALVSRRGTRREQNQDAAIVLVDVPLAGRRVHALAVFDGVGGLPNGQEASHAARDHLQAFMAATPGPDSLLADLHRRVLEEGGACTASIILLDADERPGYGRLLQCGDSMVWLHKDELTTFSTLRTELTSGLGYHLEDVDNRRFRIGKGQTLVLTSDGIHGPIDARTWTITDPAPTAERLVREAGASDWGDDTTIIVARRNP